MQLPDDTPTGNRAAAQLAVQLQLSAQVATGVTVAPPLPVHATVCLAQVTMGFWPSVTRTYDVQLAVEPSSPVATSPTGCTPGPNVSVATPSSVQDASPAVPPPQLPATPAPT